VKKYFFILNVSFYKIFFLNLQKSFANKTYLRLGLAPRGETKETKEIVLTKILFTLLTWHFSVSAHVDATMTQLQSNQEEIISAEALTPESQDASEIAADEIVISEDLQNIEDLIEEFSDENEVLVYTDEEGNEYYIIEEEYAHAGQAQPKVRKRKKSTKRNCIASSGGASWYGPGFHGRKTANGERFNQHDLTAAHKTIKFNSLVRVTYKGRSVVVRINDAGPFVRGRVIDLSKAAAKEIGLIAPGHGHVEVEIVRCGNQPPPTRVYRITAQ
jgi:rare lipoprotein A (peptidoglycan hydrolase)